MLTKLTGKTHKIRTNHKITINKLRITMQKLPQFPRPFFAVLIIGLEIVKNVHNCLLTIFFRLDKAVKVFFG